MADKGEGVWRTIGGHEGEDGKRHGGSPVFIQGGKITRGAPSLTGRRIDALKEPADTTHRQELHQNKDYSRALWAKKARQEGIEAAARAN